MYEYELEIKSSDERGNEHIIKRYYVLPIMGRYKLKDTLDKKIKDDVEISQYKLIDYDVINWNEV